MGDLNFSKNIQLPKLTLEERRLTKETWPVFNYWSIDYTWNRIYNRENGFSPYVLGPIQNFHLQLAINPFNLMESLENKTMVDIYFPN